MNLLGTKKIKCLEKLTGRDIVSAHASNNGLHYFAYVEFVGCKELSYPNRPLINYKTGENYEFKEEQEAKV